MRICLNRTIVDPVVRLGDRRILLLRRMQQGTDLLDSSTSLRISRLERIGYPGSRSQVEDGCAEHLDVALASASTGRTMVLTTSAGRFSDLMLVPTSPGGLSWESAMRTSAAGPRPRYSEGSLVGTESKHWDGGATITNSSIAT